MFYTVIIALIQEMVQTCVVRGCGSSWCPGGVIRFHAFPKNSIRRKLWLGIVPMRMRFYESARICNLHREEFDYNATGLLKETAVRTKILNQEAILPDKSTSSLHEESIVQIAGLAVPSTSSSNYESNSPHMERGIKHGGCSLDNQISKKQCRLILGNISNLDILPVSSKNHFSAKIDRGVQVNDNFKDNFNKEF